MMTADKLAMEILQALMRHKAYLTTRNSIRMRGHLALAVPERFVSEIRKATAAGCIAFDRL